MQIRDFGCVGELNQKNRLGHAKIIEDTVLKIVHYVSKFLAYDNEEVFP